MYVDMHMRCMPLPMCVYADVVSRITFCAWERITVAACKKIKNKNNKMSAYVCD